MTDKKIEKAVELDETALDTVQGGLFSTSAAGTEIKKAPVGKRAPKPDGYAGFGAEGTI